MDKKSKERNILYQQFLSLPSIIKDNKKSSKRISIHQSAELIRACGAIPQTLGVTRLQNS